MIKLIYINLLGGIVRKTILVFISLILLICLLPLSGCKPDMVEEETTVIDPKAIEVAEIFINSFWDSQYKYFFHNNTKKETGYIFGAWVNILIFAERKIGKQ